MKEIQFRASDVIGRPLEGESPVDYCRRVGYEIDRLESAVERHMLEQLQRPEASPNTALADKYWEPFNKQWDVKTVTSSQAPPSPPLVFGPQASEQVEPFGQELDVGLHQTPTTKTISPSKKDKRNEQFRDFYYDSSGTKVYTRAPHTYYTSTRDSSTRDICAIVEQRSHSGLKGASRAQQVAMIRAYYYCRGKNK